MRTTWMLAAVAALAALPAVAQTVVEKQVTTTTATSVDCGTILNDAERLSCWQSRAYIAPAPVATQTTEKTVSTADGIVRTTETATTTAPAIVPAPVTTRVVTTTDPAPVVVSKTTTTSVTKN
ncbi:hypothetical protein [Roseiterribacter gracilis]|uniref:Uncharacterized protein n=1 Tax=Roseiterribacter gracilis TaxID=2812848 RepID=A0A8S8XBC9_9PROT|nr:hypothetical protein TMPK1_11660 [Rhodospirillales bacterium TMPK1]